jgi:microcystin-dependent protein
MPQKFSNNSRSKLAAGITASDVSFSVLAGAGDLFPVADAGADALPSENDWFKLAITDVSGEIEFVAVRTRASGSDIMSSVVRGIDGTTARTWGAGAVALQTLSSADVEAVFTPPPPAVAPEDVGALANTQLGLSGMVGYFPTADAPAGWLKANGALVSRTTYAALFAVYGVQFGEGDGSTTFQLPDLRGEFIRGLDDGRGVDAGRVIGSAQSQAIQAHTHYTTWQRRNDGNSRQTTEISATGTVDQGIVNVNTSSSGGAETRPRNIALLACIKT